MAFDKKYPDPCKWSFILPFFGFERDKETNFRSRGVYVTDTNSLSGKSKMYRSEAYQEDIYVRHTVPTGKARELEDKFLRLMSSSPPKGKYYSYVTTSLESFYKSLQREKVPRFRPVFTIIFAILIGVWLSTYLYTFPIFEQRFGYDIGSVLFVFPVPAVLILTGLLIDHIRRRAHSRLEEKLLNGFSKLSHAEKEAVRQQYFADMEKHYGKQAGAVLKEYAILKGYDRK